MDSCVVVVLLFLAPLRKHAHSNELPRGPKCRRAHSHTHIHKPCTWILKPGPQWPDCEVEVQVLWIYVLLWCCCCSFSSKTIHLRSKRHRAQTCLRETVVAHTFDPQPWMLKCVDGRINPSRHNRTLCSCKPCMANCMDLSCVFVHPLHKLHGIAFT